MSRPRSAVMSIRRYLVDFTKIRRATIWVLLMAALLQPSAASELCPLLEQATKAEVNLDGRGLKNIQHNEMKLLHDVKNLSLQDNDLQDLDPEVFSDNNNLVWLHLGGNANLMAPEDSCFLHSDTIKFLNLSRTGVCSLKPSSTKCMSSLSHLLLLEIPECEESKRLAELNNAGYKVLCGGSMTNGMSDPRTSTCSRRREGVQSPQPEAAKSKLCPLLDQAEEDVVNLNGRGLKNIQHGEMKLLHGVKRLYLQDNNLQDLDPEVFSDNKKLTWLYLGGNTNLIAPKDSCFLHSETIRFLNLSHTGVCVIKPLSMKCMPNLSRLVLLEIPGCEESKRLAELNNAGYKVLCGGSASDDMSSLKNSLCSSHRHDESSQQPDSSTSTEYAPTATQTLNTGLGATSTPSQSPTHTPTYPNSPTEDIWNSSGYVVGLVFLGVLSFVSVFTMIVLCLIYKFWRQKWDFLKYFFPPLCRLESCFDCVCGGLRKTTWTLPTLQNSDNCDRNGSGTAMVPLIRIQNQQTSPP